jgi:uncharacterized membrane protein YfcA
MDPLLVVAGFGIGILVGTTGMGGGSLMTPILILLFGTAPTTAIGSDIAYAAITKTVGGWRHLRLGSVNVPLAMWLAAGSVPAAIAGVWTISLLRNAYGDSLDDIVLTALGIALVAVGLLVLIRAMFVPSAVASERESFVLSRSDKAAAAAIGAATGFVIGITSAGSGTLIAVFLIALFRLAPRQVVGTDVFHAAILLWAAGIAHTIGGNVDFAIVGTILLGSIPGISIGSHLTVRLPTGLLRIALGVVMVLSALALFDKAGIQLPLALVIALPVALVAALLARALLHARRGPAASSPAPPG